MEPIVRWMIRPGMTEAQRAPRLGALSRWRRGGLAPSRQRFMEKGARVCRNQVSGRS